MERRQAYVGVFPNYGTPEEKFRGTWLSDTVSTSIHRIPFSEKKLFYSQAWKSYIAYDVKHESNT